MMGIRSFDFSLQRNISDKGGRNDSDSDADYVDYASSSDGEGYFDYDTDDVYNNM